MNWNTNSRFHRLWNSMIENKLFWLLGSSLIIIVISALILYYNITLNFTILGLLIILSWLLIFGGYTTFQRKSRLPRTNGMMVKGKENAEFAMLSCITLLIIGILAIHTIDNYFYPEEQVYRNIDHHVVRLDGAQITHPHDYVLAENSPSAFLDNRMMNGKISIVNSYDSAAITLLLDRCTRTLYSNIYNDGKRCIERRLLNKDQLLHFNDGAKGDTLFLRLSNGQELKFFTKICKEDNDILKTPHYIPFIKRYLIFSHRKDSAIYGLQVGDSTYYSEEHRILTSGLALNDLLKGINLHDIDFSGINIVRPIIYPTELNDLKVFRYDTLGYNVEYVSIVNPDSLTTVTHIRSCTDATWHPLRTNSAQTIDVPYGTSISLGFPMNSNQQIYFTKDSAENVYIHYRQPKRAYLPGEIKDKQFNSVYVATSLSSDAEKLQFVPEQIILFDVFEKFTNGNNLTPFTLSYIAGPTTQGLELIAKTDNRQDTLRMDKWAIMPIKDIQSLNGNIRWKISIENLKQTTNCKISMIKRNIILLTIALAIIMLIGSVRFLNDTEEKEKRNTYTFAEFVIFSIILYLLTFRWFLLWRTSVFLPTEYVSYYEYETIFRGRTNITGLNTIILTFVSLALIMKIALIPETRSFLTNLWSEITTKPKIREHINRIVEKSNSIKEDFTSKWIELKDKIHHLPPYIYGLKKWNQLIVKPQQIRQTLITKLPLKFKDCLRKLWDWIKKVFNIACWNTSFWRLVLFNIVVIIGIIFRNIEIVTRIAIILGVILSISYILKCVLYSSKCIPIWCIVIFLFVTIVSFAFRTSPAISIITAVMGFILSVTISNGKLLEHYKVEDQQCDYLSNSHPFAYFLWSVILHIIFYSAILFFLDSGYAILFLTFCAFYLIWLLHEYVTVYLSNETYDIKRDWCVFGLFIGFICLLCYYRDLFHFILDKNLWNVGITFAIITACVLALACHVILNIKKTRESVILLITCSVLIGGIAIGFKSFLPKYAAHTTERITVHFAKPEEVMGAKESEQDMQKYLEAAINHMIIGEYEERGHEVKVFGERSLGYFKMQPHSKIGAMWNAQLTDISLVRYCIAEHGIWLPFCFILAFIVMLFASVRMPLYHRWARTILILVPLLFSVQSLLIWMANTQRFIFLGQDFPLVSINSRLTLTFFFGLTLLWIAILLYENVNFHKMYEDNDDAYDLRLDNDWRYEVARRDSLKVGMIMVVALCFCAGIHHLRNKPDKTFEVNSLMANIQKEIDNTINPLLKAYQVERGPFSLKYSNIHNDIVAFNQAKNVENYIAQNVSDTSCTHLVETLWNNFVEKGSKNNSSSLVMHARLVRDTIHEGGREKLIKVAQIRVIQKYFDKQLPKRNEHLWKGSLVTRSYDKRQLLTAQYGSAQTYSIPEQWLESSNSVIIIKTPTGKYNATVKRGDNVTYLARNVRVNGTPMFIYPLEEKFYWIRNFTEQIAHQKNKLKDNDRNEQYNDNIEMTISSSLTRSLYGYLKQSGIEDPSIMVADGDGDVLAMVSYDKEYHLNPNDRMTILSLYDSLYLNGLNGSPLELRAFANKNLIHLPGGPGSSQKPLVWTAVASTIEFPWKDLMVAPYYGKIGDSDNTHYKITKFNNHDFRSSGFNVLKSDENNGNGVDLEGFMTHSSNVYNALMAYIGSFTNQAIIDDIENIGGEKDGNKIFAYTSPRIQSLNTDTFRNQFPILYYRDAPRKPYVLDAFPDINNQKNSILEKQIYHLFLNDKIKTHAKTKQSSTAGEALSVNDIINNFSYCAQSSLQNRGNSMFDYMEKGIRSTAIGAQSVWDITPWKMAESYGRMASLNKNYTLSVIKQPKPVYERFDKLTEGYKGARGIQMKGMGKVLTAANGTAKSLGSKLNLPIVNRERINKYGDYYLYAKTGTTDNGVTGRGHKEFHRLGVIIANKDLSEISIDELHNVKYYVVYFAIRNNGEKWKLYADCIKEIMESEEFNNYMKQN